MLRKLYQQIFRPVVHKASREDFRLDDVFNERTDCVIERCYNFENLVLHRYKNSVWKALFQMLWMRWLILLCPIAGALALRSISPIFLYRIYRLYNGDIVSPNASLYIILYLAVFVVIDIIARYLNEIFWTNFCGIRVEIENWIKFLLYRKSLRMIDRTSAREKVTGLLENDVWRIGWFFYHVINTPRQLYMIIMSFGYLFYVLGWSTFTGIAVVLVFLLPVNYIAIRYSQSLEKSILEKSDKRIQIMNDIISSIRFIKSYVWEEIYEKKVMKVRNEETWLRKKSCYSWGIVELLWITSTFFVGSFTYFVYVYAGNVLTTSICYMVASMNNNITYPIFSLSSCYNEYSKIRISLKRIVDFMDLENVLNCREKKKTEEKKKSDEIMIKYEKCSFTWKDMRETKAKELEKGDYIVEDMTFDIKKGEFIGVIGKIGSGKLKGQNIFISNSFVSGKTTLISSIMGELNQIEGDRYIKEGAKLTLFSQKHWIRSQTIRENILFGNDLDEEKYERSIDCCSLKTDLEEFPKGDQTKVGERGVTLSGGQQARISLARLAYNCLGDKEKEDRVLIFDDPVKDLDEIVSNLVVENLFLKELEGKTRILVTHKVNCLKFCDRIMVLEKGKISKICKPEEVIENFSKDERGESKDEKCVEESLKDEKEKKKVETNDEDDDEAKLGDKLDYSLIWYFITYHKGMFIFLLFLVIVKCILECVRDKLLGNWSSDTELKFHSMNYYIVRDLSLGIVISIVVVAFQILFARHWLNLVDVFHGFILKRLLKGRVSWFDKTSSGAILSRFSTDLCKLDEDLRWRMRELFLCITYMASIYIFIIYLIPLYICVLVPLLVFFYLYFKKFFKVFVKVSRMTSISHSPLLTHSNETLEGLAIIRSFQKQDQLTQEYIKKMTKKMKLNFVEFDLAFWFTTRIHTAVTVSILFFGVCTCLIKSKDNGVSQSIALTKLIDIAGLITWIFQLMPTIQKISTSLERIVDYSKNIAIEENKVSAENKFFITEENEELGEEKGKIEFKNVTFKYKDDDYVVKDVSFAIPPGSRLGICGRTGSGKSTLVKLLFRLYELEDEGGGEIMIDGVNVRNKKLDELRSSMCYIAQNPCLLSGSLRENIDGKLEKEDKELWEVLEIVGLKENLHKMKCNLDTDIEDIKFSAGEKQLICMCRALIKKEKILVLDEASSSCDLKTDEKIHELISKYFKDSTVISIAHRLETIIKFEKLMVLKKGRIEEFGDPVDLLKNENSLFYEMVIQMGKERSFALRKLAEESSINQC